VSSLGVVTIGRNEGPRLERCLEALAGVDATVVYVDSGSTDNSLELARARGVELVELDMSIPFSAARARNAGFERLARVDPDVRYVQFLDGDCEIAAGWLDRARSTLEQWARAAVVFGRLNERFPERSIYNRLADLEWNAPIVCRSGGRSALACGGIAMIRAEAFRAVGGYNPTIPAGEEPELCQRLRDSGWSIVRLDAEMAWHDIAMLRFRQWARRQVRTGYGGLDFETRFGARGKRPFLRQVRSVWCWTIAWPMLVVAGGVLGSYLLGPLAGGLIAVFFLAMFPAQVVRIARRNRSPTCGPRTALIYGTLTLVAKWFQMYGQALYLRDRFANRHARLIEYKATR
jgi:GT2 family glycosyltransferase